MSASSAGSVGSFPRRRGCHGSPAPPRKAGTARMPKLPLSPVPEQEIEEGGPVPGGGSAADAGKGSPRAAAFSRSSVEPQAVRQDRASPSEDESSGKGSEEEAEDEWDTDIELEDRKEFYDPAGKAKYLQTCQAYNVVPVSYFMRHMKDPELSLKHRGLGTKGVKALALSLTCNTSVLKLNLSDNGVEEDGAAAVAEMLKENCFISDVDLSDNRVGVGGAKALAAVFRENSSLTVLKLSGNELNDSAVKYLTDAFASNTKVELLDLSHNTLGEPAGELLGTAIAENAGMKVLNLSWNYLWGRGAVSIAKGLGANVFLRVLDLSYNGFGNSGAAALGDALKANNVLEELHIGNNHISLEGALQLALGLKVNKTLRVLSLPRNPIQSSGCSGILKAIRTNPDTALEVLDLSEIVVKQEFARQCEAVQEAFPGLQIKHDGISRSLRTERSKVTIQVPNRSQGQSHGLERWGCLPATPRKPHEWKTDAQLWISPCHHRSGSGPKAIHSPRRAARRSRQRSPRKTGGDH